MLKLKYEEDFAMVLDDVYTAQECQEWMDLIDTQKLEMAMINVGDGKQEEDQDVRKHLRWMSDDPVRAGDLWSRIREQVVEHYPGTVGKPVGLNERLRALKYNVGDYFKPHEDGQFEKDGQWSELTVMVYLNDGFKGGETVFLNDNDMQFKYPYVPKQGSVLIFEHELLHEGATLEEGTKYVIRTDVMFE